MSIALNITVKLHKCNLRYNFCIFSKTMQLFKLLFKLGNTATHYCHLMSKISLLILCMMRLQKLEIPSNFMQDCARAAPRVPFSLSLFLWISYSWVFFILPDHICRWKGQNRHNRHTRHLNQDPAVCVCCQTGIKCHKMLWCSFHFQKYGRLHLCVCLSVCVLLVWMFSSGQTYEVSSCEPFVAQNSCKSCENDFISLRSSCPLWSKNCFVSFSNSTKQWQFVICDTSQSGSTLSLY